MLKSGQFIEDHCSAKQSKSSVRDSLISIQEQKNPHCCDLELVLMFLIKSISWMSVFQKLYSFDKHISGLAVDWIGNFVYWTSEEKGEVRRMDTNGKNERTLLRNLTKPSSISVDPTFRWIALLFIYTSTSSYTTFEKKIRNIKNLDWCFKYLCFQTFLIWFYRCHTITTMSLLTQPAYTTTFYYNILINGYQILLVTRPDMFTVFTGGELLSSSSGYTVCAKYIWSDQRSD